MAFFSCSLSFSHLESKGPELAMQESFELCRTSFGKEKSGVWTLPTRKTKSAQPGPPLAWLMPRRLRNEKRAQKDPLLGEAGTWCAVRRSGAPSFILTNHTFHPQNLETANQKLIWEVHHEQDERIQKRQVFKAVASITKLSHGAEVEFSS